MLSPSFFDCHEDARSAFEAFIKNLFLKISHFAVRETKESGVIKLPKKEIHTITTDWEHQQYDLYRRIQKEMRAVVIRNGLPTQDDSEELLKRLLRLVQVASNPRLVDEGYNREPGKLSFLKDIIERIKSNDEKCIVWSAFTDNVDWLARELSIYGTRKVHGKLSIDRRNQAIEKFLSDSSISILTATPGAAKEGLTLTAANHVIFYDRTFSLDDYIQSQDRIHRISQTRNCYVYNLIMKESIDGWVDILLHAKHLAAQLAQGDISLDFYKNQMSYDFGVVIKNILEIQ
jgi:SNF2 family DNA or RNA helicase